MTFTRPSAERESRIREVLEGYLEAFPFDRVRKDLTDYPLDGLDGPVFGSGTCLDPLLTSSDIAYFEPWREEMGLNDGDLICVRWGPSWRELALAACGTDLSVKLVKHVDGEPWLVCREPAVPFEDQGHEILGVLRAVRSQRSLAIEILDLVLLGLVAERISHTHVASLGSAMMLVFADLTMNGQITGRGPVEAGQRDAMAREGWQPYSVKIGNRWLAYNRLDPIASLIGMAADATETVMHGHDVADEVDLEKLIVAGALAFAGNVTNKTYLRGVSRAIEALNDPQRGAESWVQSLAGSLVPAGLATAARAQDPTVREVNSMMDAIRARTPGLSKDLPPRRDLWGQPMSMASGLGKAFDVFSPVSSRATDAQPIDQEILRLGANVTVPAKRTSFDGVTIDLSQYPKAYSRYVELAGNALKHPAWGLGARDFLNEVVTGKHPLSTVYQLRSDGPDGGKDVFIRKEINDYRELARAKLLQEFPKLKAEVDEKKRAQRELKMPATP